MYGDYFLGWRFYRTVIFMATLAGINTELYEAAAMDGAGRWGKMRYITFPALQNTILTAVSYTHQTLPTT